MIKLQESRKVFYTCNDNIIANNDKQKKEYRYKKLTYKIFYIILYIKYNSNNNNIPKFYEIKGEY